MFDLWENYYYTLAEMVENEREYVFENIKEEESEEGIDFTEIHALEILYKDFVSEKENPFEAMLESITIRIDTDSGYFLSLVLKTKKGWRLITTHADDEKLEEIRLYVESNLQKTFAGIKIDSVTSLLKKEIEKEKRKEEACSIVIEGDSIITTRLDIVGKPKIYKVKIEELKSLIENAVQKNLNGEIEHKEFWNQVSKTTKAETENLTLNISSYEETDGRKILKDRFVFRFNISAKVEGEKFGNLIFQFHIDNDGKLIDDKINLEYNSSEIIKQVVAEELESFKKVLTSEKFEHKKEEMKEK